MKPKITRSIPQGYVEYKPELGDYPKDMFACYVRFNGDKYAAMFFTGKQSQPTWHYSFKTMTDVGKKVNESISRLMSWDEMKQKRKEERKNAVLDVKVGDLFSYSWGYDQTNLDLYQVTKVIGKTFTIRPIASKTVKGSSSDYNGMADRRVAVKDAFLEDNQIRKTLVKRSLSMDFGILSKTTEQEAHYCSWYA